MSAANTTHNHRGRGQEDNDFSYFYIFSLFEFLPLQIASPRGSACSCVRARLRGARVGLANSENKQFNNNLSGNDKESFRSVPEAPGPAPAAAAAVQAMFDNV